MESPAVSGQQKTTEKFHQKFRENSPDETLRDRESLKSAQYLFRANFTLRAFIYYSYKPVMVLHGFTLHNTSSSLGTFISFWIEPSSVTELDYFGCDVFTWCIRFCLLEVVLSLHKIRQICLTKCKYAFCSNWGDSMWFVTINGQRATCAIKVLLSRKIIF